jgi:hypothetical protein
MSKQQNISKNIKHKVALLSSYQRENIVKLMESEHIDQRLPREEYDSFRRFVFDYINQNSAISEDKQYNKAGLVLPVITVGSTLLLLILTAQYADKAPILTDLFYVFFIGNLFFLANVFVTGFVASFMKPKYDSTNLEVAEKLHKCLIVDRYERLVNRAMKEHFKETTNENVCYSL